MVLVYYLKQIGLMCKWDDNIDNWKRKDDSKNTKLEFTNEIILIIYLMKIL
jgi:hypothetical protein